VGDGQRAGQLAGVGGRVLGESEEEQQHVGLGGFLAMSEGRFTVTGMQIDNRIREQIETELSDALESGLNTEEALAEAAGLISDAEARFRQLLRPMPSMPPPRR
jgi:hypothetical protein